MQQILFQQGRPERWVAHLVLKGSRFLKNRKRKRIMKTSRQDNKELTEEFLEKIAGGACVTPVHPRSSSAAPVRLPPHRKPVINRSSSTTAARY